jgi:hypothetical protein
MAQRIALESRRRVAILVVFGGRTGRAAGGSSAL